MDGKEEELGPPDYATDPVPILPVDPIPPQMLWEDAEHCLEEHACIFCILKEGVFHTGPLILMILFGENLP